MDGIVHGVAQSQDMTEPLKLHSTIIHYHPHHHPKSNAYNLRRNSNSADYMKEYKCPNSLIPSPKGNYKLLWYILKVSFELFLGLYTSSHLPMLLSHTYTNIPICFQT